MEERVFKRLREAYGGTASEAGPAHREDCAHARVTRLLLDDLPDRAFFTLDLRGRIDGWNAAAEHLLGYSEGDILDADLGDLLPDAAGADSEVMRLLFEAAKRGTKGFDGKLLHAEGAPITVRMVIEPVDDDGAPRGFVAVVQRQADASAEPTWELDQNSVLHRLTGLLDDRGLVALDLRGRVRVWTGGAERLTGHAGEAAKGRPWESFLHATRRDAIEAMRPLYIAVAQDVYDSREALIGPDARKRDLHVRIAPLNDAGGALIGFAVLLRPPDQRDAGGDAPAARGLAGENARALLHDLREPMRKIVAFGDLLASEHGDALAGEAREYLRAMTAAGERMQELLDGLGDLAGLDAGERFVPLDLGLIVGDVCSDMELAIRESGLRVECGPLPLIEADAGQMRQLFQNLIQNSIKYARDDRSPVVWIEDVSDDDADTCVLSVRDNGLGIDPDEAEAIFAPMARGTSSHGSDGTGMGLAICRRVCRRHGGDIHALDVDRAEGAAFRIRLRRRQPGGRGVPRDARGGASNAE